VAARREIIDYFSIDRRPGNERTEGSRDTNMAGDDDVTRITHWQQQQQQQQEQGQQQGQCWLLSAASNTLIVKYTSVPPAREHPNIYNRHSTCQLNHAQPLSGTESLC